MLTRTTTSEFCPRCRQHMRCGVYFPPLKAEIFDAVKASGDIGIGCEELMDAVYHHDRSRPSPLTIKAHINQINEMLAGTDFQIRADGRRHRDGARYYLLRRRS